MSEIFRFLLNMLPYMVTAGLIYIVLRFIYIKVKNIEINFIREIVLMFFIMFLVGLASQTIIPQLQIGPNGLGIVNNRTHETNLIPLKVIKQTYIEVFSRGNINYFLINFLGNIIMFMPFGLFIPYLWGLSGKKTILIGFFSSLFIEFCQLFLSRGTDVDDLILNTLGVSFGLIIYKCIQKIRVNRM